MVLFCPVGSLRVSSQYEGFVFFREISTDFMKNMTEKPKPEGEATWLSL